MASIAGKVVPRFMGEYNASTTYQFYDAVTRNNKLYFCKKSGTVGKAPGNATDDNWFLSIDGTFTDASELGGETATQWQTKIDSIQTTSSATLSTAGWYRIAECVKSSLFNVEITLLKGFGLYHPETHIISATVNSTAKKFNVSSVDTTSNTHTLTKFRITSDSTKCYAEVYLDRTSDENIWFLVSSKYIQDKAWQAITPTLTSETVDGVTVTTTYDIPANASPVTDLDLVEHALPSFTVSSDTAFYDLLNNYSANMGGNVEYQLAVYVGFSGGALTNGTWKIYGFKNDSGYETQLAVKHQAETLLMYGRSKTGGTWYKFDKLATTADLANYLPLDGSNAMQRLLTIGSTDLAKYVAVLIKNNKRSLELGITEAGAIQFYDATNKKNVFTSALDGTNTFNGTATGNLPLTGGGTVIAERNSNVPLRVQSNATETEAFVKFVGNLGNTLGFFGFMGTDTPVMLMSDGATSKTLLHTGNSAKVVVSSTAPTDTTSAWLDTANKKTKAYIDGAWTVIA